MKRIAFYSREFRLCEWPKEPPAYEFLHEDEKSARDYRKAVTSAMENGIAFADQTLNGTICERQEQHTNRTMIMRMIKKSPYVYEEVKDGDNWPAPQEAEILRQIFYDDKWITLNTTGENNERIHKEKTRKVAVLRSESPEGYEDFVEFRRVATSVKNSAHSYTEGMNTESGESVEKKDKPEFQDIIKFLLGESSFYGIWFGEKHPTEPGLFWWRKHLKAYIDRLNQSNPKE